MNKKLMESISSLTNLILENRREGSMSLGDLYFVLSRLDPQKLASAADAPGEWIMVTRDGQVSSISHQERDELFSRRGGLKDIATLPKNNLVKTLQDINKQGNFILNRRKKNKEQAELRKANAPKGENRKDSKPMTDDAFKNQFQRYSKEAGVAEQFKSVAKSLSQYDINNAIKSPAVKVSLSEYTVFGSRLYNSHNDNELILETEDFMGLVSLAQSEDEPEDVVDFNNCTHYKLSISDGVVVDIEPSKESESDDENVVYIERGTIDRLAGIHVDNDEDVEVDDTLNNDDVFESVINSLSVYDLKSVLKESHDWVKMTKNNFNGYDITGCGINAHLTSTDANSTFMEKSEFINKLGKFASNETIEKLYESPETKDDNSITSLANKVSKGVYLTEMSKPNGWVAIRPNGPSVDMRSIDDEDVMEYDSMGFQTIDKEHLKRLMKES